MLPTVKTEGSFTTVYFPPDRVLYFSYCNLVGFQLEDGRIYIHQNMWGATTAKHINSFFNPKNYTNHSLDKEDFQEAFNTLFFKE